MHFVHKILKNTKMRYAYFGWLFIAFFYFYQYVLRVFPGVMIGEIRSFYKITAEEFATFGSLYLFAYAILQIPLGIIADRVGVKKICIYSILLCLVGTLLMGNTDSFWIAQLSRFLMGAGSASAFMCAVKFIADHIPPGKRGLLMGATLAFGTIGAILTGSIQTVGKTLGWRETLNISFIIGIIVLSAIIFGLKKNRYDAVAILNRKTFKNIVSDISKIFTSSNIIIYSVLAMGLYTPLAALTDLWGTAFLKQKYSLPSSDSAQLVMVLYIGLTFGSLLLPWIAEKFNILNQAIIFCGFMVLGIFCLIVYLPIYVDINSLIILLFLLGFFCGAEMMCFTGALQFSQKYSSGEIIGVVNTLNMLGGAVIQQMIGWSLDTQWMSAVDDEGLRQYSTYQYQLSLTLLTVLIFSCCVVSLLLLRNKHKKIIF